MQSGRSSLWVVPIILGALAAQGCAAETEGFRETEKQINTAIQVGGRLCRSPAGCVLAGGVIVLGVASAAVTQTWDDLLIQPMTRAAKNLMKYAAETSESDPWVQVTYKRDGGGQFSVTYPLNQSTGQQFVRTWVRIDSVFHVPRVLVAEAWGFIQSACHAYTRGAGDCASTIRRGNGSWSWRDARAPENGALQVDGVWGPGTLGPFTVAQLRHHPELISVAEQAFDSKTGEPGQVSVWIDGKELKCWPIASDMFKCREDGDQCKGQSATGYLANGTSLKCSCTTGGVPYDASRAEGWRGGNVWRIHMCSPFR